MKIYCTEDFYRDYKTLVRKNSYKGLAKLLFDFLTKNNEDSLKSKATCLNTGAKHPNIKYYLGGKKKYRLYYLVVNSDTILYIVYPKFGAKGKANLKGSTREAMNLSEKAMILFDDKQNIFEITFIEKDIIFEPVV